LNGLVLSVTSSEESILEEGFGYEDIQRTKPMSPHTRFSIASNTKAFTAALIALLIENNTTNKNAVP
jgi:CubicO group peptidase (beta-lactamase class C family)